METYIGTKHKHEHATIWLLLLPPIVNMVFMHYYFYFSGLLEKTFMYSVITNFMSVVFDVFVLLFFFSLLCRGKLKSAFALTNAITLLWSFINVFYGRFFFQYLPISAVTSAGGLCDSTTVAAMMDGFRMYDLFFLISPVVFIVIYQHVQPLRISFSHWLRLILPPVISLLFSIAILSAYFFIQPRYRHNLPLFGIHLMGVLYDVTCNAMPNMTHFQCGSIRVFIFEASEILMPRVLTDEERHTISQYLTPKEQRASGHIRPEETKNVVVILLESMLSHPIGLNIKGQEVTPFLNSLIADSTVYYNGSVISDITCGESGDGQFIVLNGLLPLRYKTTVGPVKDNTLLALPKLLEDQMGIKKSTIIIPTKPNMWQQSDVNSAYGIKQMYSMEDIQSKEGISNIDDAHVFNFAASKLSPYDDPFFLLILSLSTHSPYDSYLGEKLFDDIKTMPKEYCNYLRTCHFMDEQLRRYIDDMKIKGLFDKSLIVIAADHFAHLDRLHMKGRLKPYTPFFIINGNINREKAWHGECHQLDIYTTLVDVLNLGNIWNGLGHTLLSTDYVNSVDDNTYNISELIINGDYFAP